MYRSFDLFNIEKAIRPSMFSDFILSVLVTKHSILVLPFSLHERGLVIDFAQTEVYFSF
jgi:hypothetical protein